MLAQIAADPQNPLPLRIDAVGGLTKLAGPGAGDALIQILADDTPAGRTGAGRAARGRRAQDRVRASRRHATAGQRRGRNPCPGDPNPRSNPRRGGGRRDRPRAGRCRSRGAQGRGPHGWPIGVARRPRPAHGTGRRSRKFATKRFWHWRQCPTAGRCAIYFDGLLHKNPTVRAASRAAMAALRDSVGRDIIESPSARRTARDVFRVELQPIFNAPQPITTWHVVGTWPRNDPPTVRSGHRSPIWPNRSSSPACRLRGTRSPPVGRRRSSLNGELRRTN